MALIILFFNQSEYSFLYKRFNVEKEDSTFYKSFFTLITRERFSTLEGFNEIDESVSNGFLIIQDHLCFSKDKEKIKEEYFKELKEELKKLQSRLIEETEVFIILHHGSTNLGTIKEKDNQYKKEELESIFGNKIKAFTRKSSGTPQITDLISNITSFINHRDIDFSEIINSSIKSIFLFKEELNIALTLLTNLHLKDFDQLEDLEKQWDDYKNEMKKYEVLTIDEKKKLENSFQKYVNSIKTKDTYQFNKASFENFRKVLTDFIIAKKSKN